MVKAKLRKQFFRETEKVITMDKTAMNIEEFFFNIYRSLIFATFSSPCFLSRFFFNLEKNTQQNSPLDIRILKMHIRFLCFGSTIIFPL